MQDFWSNVLADVANVGSHFAFPLKRHDHSCFCLLCSNTERQSQRQECKRLQASSLIAIPTSTDLDLVKTESSSIRQLVVLDTEQTIPLTEFVSQLKTYLHFHILFNTTPKIHIAPSSQPALLAPPFHILTILSRHDVQVRENLRLEQVGSVR